MTKPRSLQRSPLALAILALLWEAPIHPYRMQQLIRERGKDRVVNVRQRASIYQTIDRLLRTELIRARETTREENRPERTVYELTDVGRQTVYSWMREALSTPAVEFPEFPAAVSFVAMLTPEDMLQQLELRESALAKMLAENQELIQKVTSVLPRVVLLEEEVLHATLEAELNWVRAVITDLRSGQLSWDASDLKLPLQPVEHDSKA